MRQYVIPFFPLWQQPYTIGTNGKPVSLEIIRRQQLKYFCWLLFFIGFHFSFHFHSFFSESSYKRAMLKTKTLERGCEPFLVFGSWAEPRCSYGGGCRAWYSCLHPACQGKNPSPPLIPLHVDPILVTGTRDRHYHPSSSDSWRHGQGTVGGESSVPSIWGP